MLRLVSFVRPLAAAVLFAVVFPCAAAPSYGDLPLSFERNEGQAAAPVHFLSRGRGYSLFLTANAATLRLQGAQDATAAVRWELAGGNGNARVTGERPLPGRSNYLIGDDPSRWRTGVETFASVRYEGVYPGIDLVYYGNQRQVEYDFVVAPNADPRQIRLSFDGIDALRISADGALLIETAHGNLVQPRPTIYQERDGKRVPVDGHYTLAGRNQVAFSLGDYDRTRTLTIDPVLHYSTFFGGSGLDQGLGIAVDSSGNAYVAGFVASTSLPGSSGSALQSSSGGGTDAFVTKINATGTAVVYSTFLGGNGDNEYAMGIALDSSGNAYVAGGTNSTNFPGVTGSSIQTSFAGGNFDAFVTKINAAGSAISYSTYLGGTNDDIAVEIAVDGSGNAYVTGSTASTSFPGTSGSAIRSTLVGDYDAFATKINAAGSAISYSTYLGGTAYDVPSDITVDSSGNAYLIGATYSTTFTGVTGGSLQSANGGGSDAFLTKINAAGSATTFSTFLGGTGDDWGSALVRDSSGNLIAAGDTTSTTFPGVTGGSLQSANAGSNDAFVTKLNSAASAITWSTFLGGSAVDVVGTGCLSLDSSNNIYIAGVTQSTSFPGVTGSSIQPTAGGGVDSYVAKLAAAGTSIGYATFLGGTGDDAIYTFTTDAAGNAYASGNTTSTAFPGVNGSSIQSTAGGGSDAFIVKIGQGAPSLTSISPTSGYPGTQVTINGSGFGITQGSGSVWLGNKLAGSIVSWSNTQIVAVVAATAVSGSAQVQQNGAWSNSIAFTVIQPNITSISPTSGYPGTQVTINGTNFGATQGSGSVWLGNKLAGSIVSWSNTQIVAVVAATALSGSAQVQQAGLWSNSIAFTVIQPNITSISPTSGYPGTQVTINGTNFGATQGSGSVWLGNKLAGSIVSWSNTQIVAVVAATALTGSAQVQQGGVWSNSLTFTVIQPNITSISPTSGVAGTQVTFTGTNFGATQGSGSVWLGSKLAGSIVSWSNTSIVATVDSGSVTGSAQVQQGGVWSNSPTFTVLTPTLTSISPGSATAGDPVTLTGTNFGATQGSGSVWLGSKLAASIVSWSNTSIVATVDNGSITGTAQVQQGGVWTNAEALTIVTPEVESVDPESGPVGTEVTLSGSGFGATQGSGLVWIGTKLATVTSWDDTEVTAVVASGSATGGAQVFQHGVWSNAITFTVVPPGVEYLSFDSSQLSNGQSATGYVSLNTTAGVGGAVVTLAASNPSLLDVPASVTVPAGESEATFTATALSTVATSTPVTVTASWNSTEAPAEITILPPAVVSVTVDPSTVESGEEVTIEVTLSEPAAAGTVVELESSNETYLEVPATLAFTTGETTAQTTVQTNYVPSTRSETVTATLEASEASGTVTLDPPSLTLDSVTVSPTSVVGSNPVTLTVTLTEAAPVGGAEIDLYGGFWVERPPFVVIPEGETSITVPVRTMVMEETRSTYIRGIFRNRQRDADLELLAPPANFVSSLTLASNQTAGGNLVTATVTLNAAAGVGGAEIALDSSDVVVATVPASVTVAQGDTTATFDVDTDAVLAPVDVYMTGSYNDVLSPARLTVVPAPSTVSLASVSVPYVDVLGEDDVIATITLSGPAPAGGIVVTLSGSRANLATVPASVTVPEGETSSTVTITTEKPPTNSRNFLLTATYDGIVRSLMLEVHRYWE
jgi:hypothetical protein